MPRFIRCKRRHTGEKPYVYKESGRAFSSESNLTKHEKIHTRKKALNIINMEKSLARSNTSLKIKTFVLETLNVMNVENFQPKNLSIQQMIHKREKSYECTRYDKAFIQKSSLLRHQISPTGDKSYACNEGEKAFNGK